MRRSCDSIVMYAVTSRQHAITIHCLVTLCVSEEIEQRSLPSPCGVLLGIADAGDLAHSSHHHPQSVVARQDLHSAAHGDALQADAVHLHQLVADSQPGVCCSRRRPSDKNTWSAFTLLPVLPAELSSSTLLTNMPSPCSEPPRTLKPRRPSGLLLTVSVWMSSLSSPPANTGVKNTFLITALCVLKYHSCFKSNY